MTKSTTKLRLQAYLNSGATGTVVEISDALGVGTFAAYAMLRRLADERLARRIGREDVVLKDGRITGYSDVWGAAEEIDDGFDGADSIVQRAMANRTPIETAWFSRGAA